MKVFEISSALMANFLLSISKSRKYRRLASTTASNATEQLEITHLDGLPMLLPEYVYVTGKLIYAKILKEYTENNLANDSLYKSRTYMTTSSRNPGRFSEVPMTGDQNLKGDAKKEDRAPQRWTRKTEVVKWLQNVMKCQKCRVSDFLDFEESEKRIRQQLRPFYSEQAEWHKQRPPNDELYDMEENPSEHPLTVIF